MSGWPQGGAGAGYPGPPPASPPKPPPSAGWYWVGVLLLVGGVVGGVVVIVSSFSGAFTRPLDIGPDGTRITATEPNQVWTVYEAGVTTFGLADPPPCSVGGPGGEPQVVGSLGATTLTLNGTTYHDVGTFTTPQPGTYTVRCDEALAVGPSIAVLRTVGGTFLGVGLIIVGGLAGTVVLIVTGVVRSSRKRQAAQAAGGWPGAAPPGPPGQPWRGQPPGPWTST